jgi:hypothetical protein
METDDPLTELATIFAAAILRLQRREALDSSAEALEVSPETVLSVTHGS